MLGAVLLVVALAWPAQAAAEHIRSYRTDLTIRADGVLHVHEVISYDFGDARGRHGIERTIPDRDGRRLYDIGHVRVTADGKRAETRTTHQRDTLTIRIGDEHATVSGVRTYAIDYDVTHALTPYDDHDELYWDAIGTGWSVPIDAATVRVSAPAAPTYARCFAGHESAHHACGGRTVSGKSASFGRRLGARQGMTVKIKLPKGAVHVPPPHYERPAWAVTWVGYLVFGLVCALLVAARFWVRWRQRPRPVPDLLALVGPAELRHFIPRTGRRVSNEHAVVLVDLAVRGHLHIHDDGSKVTLTRTPHAEPSRPYERTLLDKVFESGGKVRISKARRDEISNVGLWREIDDALRALRLIRQVDSYDYELVQRTLGIAALAVAAVLVVVDLWGRFNLRSFSVGDLTASGVALLVLGVVLLCTQDRIDRYTFAGARIRAVLERYAPTVHLGQADGERHLPYAMAAQSWSAVEEFGIENADGLDWYTYTGDAENAGERFTALSWLFNDPDYRPTRSSEGRWSLPSERSSTGRSGGYSGYSYTSPSSYGGGGGGGGSVGGGGGGGGGGSW